MSQETLAKFAEVRNTTFIETNLPYAPPTTSKCHPCDLAYFGKPQYTSPYFLPMVKPLTDLNERYDAVGAAIRRDRDGSLSQTQFCERAGVSTTKFRELENGKPGNYRSRTLLLISRAIWSRDDVLERILAGEALDAVLSDGAPRSGRGAGAGTDPAPERTDDPERNDDPVAGGAAAAAAFLDVLERARASATQLAPFDGDAAFDAPRAQLRAVLGTVRRSVPALVGIVRDAADRLEALDADDPAALTTTTLDDASSLASTVTSIVGAFGLPAEFALAADGEPAAARHALDAGRRRRRPSPPPDPSPPSGHRPDG